MDNILSADQSTISSQDLLKYGYVYITTNLINGKKYIGVHKSSCFDESYKGSGKILWRAINKYGWENFKTEIIKWCYSKEELFESEKEEINSRGALASDDFYNVMPGGHGGDNKTFLSPEDHDSFVKKISESKSNRPRTEREKQQLDLLHSSRVGSHMREESKEKSRLSNTGQVRSDVTRKNMSENHADFSGDRNPFYNKSHSDESRRKISINNARSHKGKIWITNKVDCEVLVFYEDLCKYEGFVRGRLRKSQRR